MATGTPNTPSRGLLVKGGWYGAKSPKGGIRIENFDFVPCRVPEWLVSWDEPIDKDKPPGIPEGADWKLFPTD